MSEEATLVGYMPPSHQQLVAELFQHLGGSTTSHALVVAVDSTPEPIMRLLGTTTHAGVLMTAALLMLRRARGEISAGAEYHHAGKLMEALQSAIPFLEAVGLVEPDTRKRSDLQ